METSDCSISMIIPIKGKTIDVVNKKSKYIVKILATTDLSEALFNYSKCFFEAAHKITEFILCENHPDIGKLDTYFFSIAFLYRHGIELGLKAIGFQYIQKKDEREKFVKTTRHDLSSILSVITENCLWVRPEDELKWLQKYFADLSQMDRESDSFRYPFHITRNPNTHEFDIKKVFEYQTHIDLVKFANKFEAAYEIIEKWYNKNNENANEWKNLFPIFIEEGGNYYEQSVVGYKYNGVPFFPYTKAYLETANYLKKYMKKEIDNGKNSHIEHLFLPMCYLYRNCVELSLKTIWFDEINGTFQVKCKCMFDKKHSILGMWKEIRSHVMHNANGSDDVRYLSIIEEYCKQIHDIDSDANKFRYPMSKDMRPYFSSNKRFDFIETGDFFEALNNGLAGIDSQLKYLREEKTEIEYYINCL